MNTAPTPLRARRPRRHALAHVAAVAVAAGLGVPAQAATYIWNGGNFVPGVTAPSPLTAGDFLEINAGAFKFFSGVTFDVASGGTVNWNADTLFLQSGAVVNNAGLWQAMGDNSLLYNGGAQPAFNNGGTFRKAGGIGSTTINSGVGFSNTGVIDAQTGIINFAGGTTFNTGSVFMGAGAVQATGNNTFSGAFTSSNLELVGGTHIGSAAVVGGSVKYSGGTLAGTWTVAAGQTLAGSAGGLKFLSGATTTLTNQGNLVWDTANTLFLQSGAVLVNQGLFSATRDEFDDLQRWRARRCSTTPEAAPCAPRPAAR